MINVTNTYNKYTFQERRLQVAQQQWFRIMRQQTMPDIQENNRSSNNNNSQKSTEAILHRLHDINSTDELYDSILSDNDGWGDKLSDKSASCTRVYSLNVNGFKLDRTGGQFSEYGELHDTINADISCIQEHNLDSTQTQVRSVMYDNMRKRWKHSRLTFSSTPIRFVNQYKPGGTMIVSTGSITGRVIENNYDPWGRWSYQIFRGMRGKKITFISAYQVVKTSGNITHKTTIAAQQMQLLFMQNDPILSPRAAFRRDLAKFISLCIADSQDICLVGDFNEELGEDQNGMSQIASEFHLIDLMRYKHPELSSPRTYARGRKRLDYALGTVSIAEALTACGYEEFKGRFDTDHRPMFLDFSTEMLFGNTTQTLSSPSSRGFYSNNTKQVSQYLREKHRMLTDHNAFERAKQLQQDGNRHEYAERLDSDMVSASLSAEKQIQHFFPSMWSLQLDKARRRVNILRRMLSMFRLKLDLRKQIQKLQELDHGGSTILTPETRQECSVQLRASKQHLNQIIKDHYKIRSTERDEQIARLEASMSMDDKK